MTDPHGPTPTLELPRLEDVERGLDLAKADRGDLPGLFQMNVARLPQIRTIGFALALVVLGIHNQAVFGALDWSSYLRVSFGVLGYCLASWVLLRLFFVPVAARGVHLGTVFVWTDLLAFTAIVYASGGERSLLWPMYFVRVADQIWISRARAAALAGGGIACYAGLVAWMALVEARALDLGIEGVKLLALAAMSAALAAVATQPWAVQERTTEARDLIARLAEQSRALDRERMKAEAANRAKSDFLARMSHELRTPLNSVVGFTNVLLRTAENRERDYLRRIQKNGMHLLGLIDDILDLAKIEEGRLQVRVADVDLAKLVRETVTQLEGRALGTDVTLSFTAPMDLEPLRADDVRFRQVLTNVIGNALKFTERGRVEVVVEAAEDGWAPARVRVRDTGIGIPADRLAHIFQPFEQADGTTSRKYGGAGLGLAISRSLCELMGFRLTVESELDRGSVFTIELRPKAPPRG